MPILRTAIAFAVSLPVAAATFFGPSPYTSLSDSPFSGVTFTYFYLEDFEDGALNTPGVSEDTGIPLGPGVQTDSVDFDDGAIDGSGNGGASWFSSGGTTTFRFTFDRRASGGLPTHAGIVWTDVGEATTPGVADVIFEAFDSSGASLGTITGAQLGDGNPNGGTGEDRFFGVFNRRGISAIEIRVPSSVDWEVDHLQYGKQSRRAGVAEDDEELD